MTDVDRVEHLISIANHFREARRTLANIDDRYAYGDSNPDRNALVSHHIGLALGSIDAACATTIEALHAIGREPLAAPKEPDLFAADPFSELDDIPF